MFIAINQNIYSYFSNQMLLNLFSRFYSDKNINHLVVARARFFFFHPLPHPTPTPPHFWFSFELSGKICFLHTGSIFDLNECSLITYFRFWMVFVLVWKMHIFTSIWTRVISSVNLLEFELSFCHLSFVIFLVIRFSMLLMIECVKFNVNFVC